MENVICKSVVILFVLFLKGAETTQASPVSLDVNFPRCSYKSNMTCIVQVTLIVSSAETEQLSFLVDYYRQDNGDERNVADCAWVLGKFKCNTENGYNYTTPVNGSFHLHIDLSIHCLSNATFRITLNQHRKIVCILEQDLNRTSGDGKCTEIVLISEASLIAIVLPIVIVAVIVVLAIVGYCYREQLKKFCCKCNEDARRKAHTKANPDDSNAPLNANQNPQNGQGLPDDNLQNT